MLTSPTVARRRRPAAPAPAALLNRLVRVMTVLFALASATLMVAAVLMR